MFLTSAVYIGISSSNIDGLKSTVGYDTVGVIYGLFYASFGVVQLFRQFDGCKCSKDPSYKRAKCCFGLYGDAVFVLLSITSKIVLSWVVIAIIMDGFSKLSNEPSTWNEVQLGVIVGGIVILVGGLIAIACVSRIKNPIHLNSNKVISNFGKPLKFY